MSDEIQDALRKALPVATGEHWPESEIAKLADAFLAELNKGGLVVVPREALVEKLGRAMASIGHSMSPDCDVPIYKDDTDEVLRYEPYWKFHKYDKEAEAVIAKLEAAPSS